MVQGRRRAASRRSPIGTTALTRASPITARNPRRSTRRRIGSVQGKGRVHRGSSRARPGGVAVPRGGARVPADVAGIAERQTVVPWGWVIIRGRRSRSPGSRRTGAWIGRSDSRWAFHRGRPVLPSSARPDGSISMAGRPDDGRDDRLEPTRLIRPGPELLPVAAPGPEPIGVPDDDFLAAVAVEVRDPGAPRDAVPRSESDAGDVPPQDLPSPGVEDHDPQLAAGFPEEDADPAPRSLRPAAPSPSMSRAGSRCAGCRRSRSRAPCRRSRSRAPYRRGRRTPGRPP